MGIACFWYSCIDGFHRSSRPSRLSGPRPSCVGIGRASAGTGVGKAQNAMRPILKFKIVDPRRGRSLIAQWRQILADHLVSFVAPFVIVGKLGSIEVEHEKPKGR